MSPPLGNLICSERSPLWVLTPLKRSDSYVAENDAWDESTATTEEDMWSDSWFADDPAVSSQSTSGVSASCQKLSSHDSGKVNTSSASTLGVGDWDWEYHSDYSPSSSRTVSPDNIPANFLWLLDGDESGYDGDDEM